uniref:Uncharacterized protein n=1 Tax=Panagrolaimus sp. ES5 TaxID=591445 RepID=A0AC34GJX9_9BILA
MVKNQNLIYVSSTEPLPYTNIINLKKKKGDTLKVKENGVVVEKIQLEKHDSTVLKLEIDVNGIYSLTVKQEEDTTFNPKKLYNVSRRLPKYDQNLHAIGIDLGTTECACSVIRHDGVRSLQVHPASNLYSMPSYVFFEEQKPICGHVAVARMKNKADFIVYDAKRFIGKSFDKIVIDPLW